MNFSGMRHFTGIVLGVVTAFYAQAQAPDLFIPDRGGELDQVVTFPVQLLRARNAVTVLGFDVQFDPQFLEFSQGFTLGQLTNGFTSISVSEVGPGVARFLASATTPDTPIEQGRSAKADTAQIPQGASGTILSLSFLVKDCAYPSSKISMGNFVGDIATWSAADGSFSCDAGAQNTLPSAFGQAVNVQTNTAKDIVLRGADPDGDFLTFTVESGPGHGTVVQSVVGDPEVTYTPEFNYVGPDSFIFQADDGTGFGNSAIISINVTGAIDTTNAVPIAFSIHADTEEDSALSINLVATDADGDALAYFVVTGPSHGSLAGPDPGSSVVTYTPTPHYDGQDTFSYAVNDGRDDSNTATVTITIDGVNDAPIATGQALSTPEDIPLDVTLQAVDPDGDPVVVQITSLPSHGSLTPLNGGADTTYTPAVNFNGLDSFTFIGHDGIAQSQTTVISIEVGGVNDRPIAGSQVIEAISGSSIEVMLLATDFDGDPLEFEVVDAPLHGTIESALKAFQRHVYTADADFEGQDSFSFRVNDGDLYSNTATITVNVRTGGEGEGEGEGEGQDQAPIADAGIDQHVRTGDLAAADGSGSYDPELGTITYAWTFVSVPQDSSIDDTDLSDPIASNPTFTPDLDGDYVLSLTVTDSFGQTDSDTVVLIAFLGNVPPNADAGDDVNVTTGSAVVLDGSGSVDPDAGPLALTFTWSLVSTPAGSALTSGDIANSDTSSAGLSPDADGEYVLALEVFDGAESDADTVTVSATSSNTIPNADAGTDQNMSLSDFAVLDGSGSNDADNQPNPLSYLWTFVSLPPGSVLTNSSIADAGSMAASFVPDLDGAYVLRLTVSDGPESAADDVLIRAITPGTTDVTELTAVTSSNEHDEADDAHQEITTTLDVTIENASDGTIAGPLRAGFSFPSPGTSMPGASGSTAVGDPYFEILDVAGVDQLAPGDAVTFTVSFVSPAAQPLLYTVTPYGTLNGAAGASPLRHVGPDFFTKGEGAPDALSCAAAPDAASGAGAVFDFAVVALSLLIVNTVRRADRVKDIRSPVR